MSHKLDNLAIMADLERHTYEQWLSQPEVILALLRGGFPESTARIAWGKIHSSDVAQLRTIRGLHV